MRQLFSLISCALITASMAGCSVLSSDLLEFKPDGGCQSGAGTYYLPKTHLGVKVERLTYANTDIQHQITIKKLRVPDRYFGYCLDYLSRLTSDDIVHVKRYSNTQLLGLVSTDVVDQSGAILRTFVRAVLGGLAGRTRVAGTAQKATVFEADYDPFDVVASAQVNDALRKFGFCLMFEGDFARDARKIQSYCSHPTAAPKAVPEPPYQLAYRDRLSADRKTLPGLFYRPRVPYSYYLFVRDVPEAHNSPWALRESAVVDLENISPILAVRVDRAFFAQRKTTLVFDEGALRNVCIYKSAELEEVGKVALDIAKSIVALPAQTFQVKIDQVSGQEALARAELAALKAQQSYDNALNKVAGTQPNVLSTVNDPFMVKTAPPTAESLKLERQTAVQAGDLAALWTAACPTVSTAAPLSATNAPGNTIGGITQ